MVDDEVVVAEDIRRQLRSLGYTVVGVASSGVDAIRLGAEHRPDLIKPFVSTDLRAAVELALFRHRVTKAAEQRGRWFDAVVQSIGDAVITVDHSGSVTMVNPAAEVLTGWTQAEAMGRAIAEIMRLLHPESRCLMTNPALRAIETGQVSNSGKGGTLLVGREGAERLIGDNAAPIRDAHGTLTGAVLVFRPVS
jgi:PAS domain S-box-containing protein